MLHKPKQPTNETELRILLDNFYQTTLKETADETFEGYKGLIEIASSKPVIVKAIHKLKGNSGSMTPGVDNETIRKFLDSTLDEVIKYVENQFTNYTPKPVRRKYIPKPGKEEKRPLGIPAIGDRIVQECIRSVIEPICEAQFFKHSYGFRPWREQQHAIARINYLAYQGKYHWVVEGDISKFFDKVNHNIMIKKLWGLGIRDKRILAMIKAMLKAGIMGETKKSELGTPQGGIISPLLSNVYLTSFDKWIAREWEDKIYYHKHTGEKLAPQQCRNRARNHSNLKPVFIVRYADDWVLMTNSQENAERWKYKAKQFLENNLKLELSEEKTKITCIRKKPVKFLGFEINLRKDDKGQLLSNIGPDRERLESKMKQLYKETRKIRKQSNTNFAIDQIIKVNSITRGIINYYEIGNLTSVMLQKYAGKIQHTAFKAVQRYGGKAVKAKETDNLLSIHSEHETLIPAITYRDKIIGVTYLSFTKRVNPELKKPLETPYTKEGREIYEKRTGKKPLLVRADELLSSEYAGLVASGKLKKKYNFEYYMNRAYTFNRDKGKCKICLKNVNKYNVHIHHIYPHIPTDEINRVVHLATTCSNCHKKIHNTDDYSTLDKKVWNKIQKYRSLLEDKNPKTMLKTKKSKRIKISSKR